MPINHTEIIEEMEGHIRKCHGAWEDWSVGTAKDSRGPFFQRHREADLGDGLAYREAYTTTAAGAGTRILVSRSSEGTLCSRATVLITTPRRLRSAPPEPGGEPRRHSILISRREKGGEKGAPRSVCCGGEGVSLLVHFYMGHPTRYGAGTSLSIFFNSRGIYKIRTVLVAASAKVEAQITPTIPNALARTILSAKLPRAASTETRA